MSVFSQVGTSIQQIGGNCPDGFIEMKTERPSRDYIAGDNGIWIRDEQYYPEPPKFRLIRKNSNLILTLSDDKVPESNLFNDMIKNGEAIWEENIDIDYYKNKKWEEVKKLRTEKDVEPIPYRNVLLDFDELSSQKIDKARLALQSAKDLNNTYLTSVAWTCFDNSVVTLTLNDFKEIDIIVAVRSNENHEKSRAIKDIIYNLKSKEEIDQLDISNLFTFDLNKLREMSEGEI